MKPLYFTLHSNLKLMILPDTMAHLDGHAVITHTYSIFKNTGRMDPVIVRAKEGKEHLQHNTDPDYLGEIRFEVPDKLFNYEPGIRTRLTSEEVTELIELLTHIRSNSQLWSI